MESENVYGSADSETFCLVIQLFVDNILDLDQCNKKSVDPHPLRCLVPSAFFQAAAMLPDRMQASKCVKNNSAPKGILDFPAINS